MKIVKNIALALLLAVVPTSLWAQGEIDAFNYSLPELSGTARYVSMGGAFGALGGDMSAITQNPAAIGVYRSNELSMTLNFSDVNTTSNTKSYGKTGSDLSDFSFHNIGYVSTTRLDGSSGWQNFNFGTSYNRIKSFDRQYRVGYNNISTSLTNYIASVTNRDIDANGAILESDMTDGNNSYYNTNIPWITTLGYNGYLIDPTDDGFYSGFFNTALGDAGYADLSIREWGSIDEYTFSVGGNYNHKVYVGASLGIVDLSYSMDASYTETIEYADSDDPDVIHEGSFTMSNVLNTSGVGVNLKLGVIARPTNSLRLGAAIHTPTAYQLTDTYIAKVYYKGLGFDSSTGNAITGSTSTPSGAYSDYQLSSPWRAMASAAYVVGKAGLISAEYEYTNYAGMKLSDEYGGDFYSTNEIIDEDFKAAHTFKVGAEFRLTPVCSLRAGYWYQTSPVDTAVLNQEVIVETAGTVTNYTLERETQCYTLGAGYRIGSISIDLAYLLRDRNQDAMAFSPIDGQLPEVATLNTRTHSVSLTLGCKF